MKRFSKPLNKVDLSRPVYFQWYQFRGLNQTAQTRRHLALFLSFDIQAASISKVG